MLRVLEKCLKCNNDCKLQSETKAQLLDCTNYISKRSRKLNKSFQNNEKSKKVSEYAISKKVA